tara:strand:+ start:536 stop:829 length:294 start_codon:yes stop_codon:yes gene_type:complete
MDGNYQFCQGIMFFIGIWGYKTRRLESVVDRHVEEGDVEQAVVHCVELGKGTGAVPVVMQSKAPLQEDARTKGKPGRKEGILCVCYPAFTDQRACWD